MTIDTIQKLCLSLPEKPERRLAAQNHFNNSGLHGVTFLMSINGAQFGLKTIFPYTVDDKSGNFFCGHHETGIFLSHYIAWQIAALGSGPVMVMEDDCLFQADWKPRVEAALRDVPANFDFLFLGSCGTEWAMKNKIKGNVWFVGYPACWHCYVVSPKGAQTLMDTQRKMFGPCDLMTITPDPNGGSIPSFRKMNVYTVLPRVADQVNTIIPK